MSNDDDDNNMQNFLLLTKIQSISRFFGVVSSTVILILCVVIAIHLSTDELSTVKTFLSTLFKESLELGTSLMNESVPYARYFLVLTAIVVMGFLIVFICDWVAYFQEWAISRNLGKISRCDAGASNHLKVTNLVLGGIVNLLLLAIVVLCFFIGGGINI